MNTLTMTRTRQRHSVASMVGALAVTFSLFMASPVPTSAQELFVLSTESGLELYQVEKRIEPDLLINTYHSGFRPKAEAGAFSNQAMFSAYGIIGKPLLVRSGLQTSPNGRILIMADLIDWHPTSGKNLQSDDLMASLFGANPR